MLGLGEGRMSTSRILTRLIVWDMRVQARENVYLFTVFTTLTFCVFIWLLPDCAPDTVVTGVLFLDPAVVGTSFVAAIVLMERSQNTLVALAVSPARPSDYVLSKIITLTFLTFAGGMALVFAAYHPVLLDRAIRFIIAIVFTGTLGVVGGVLLVATANSMNHFIAKAFPVSVVLYLAFLAHFDVVKGVWTWILFGLNPGHAMLRSLLWAADPSNVSTTEATYAFGYMGLLIAVFFVWALRLYGDNIGHQHQYIGMD
jgi:fluoroquinolone transport system permease protein